MELREARKEGLGQRKIGPATSSLTSTDPRDAPLHYDKQPRRRTLPSWPQARAWPPCG